MVNKFWAIMDDKKDFIKLTDTRALKGKNYMMTSIAIYNTEVDAQRMKRYIQEMTKDRDTNPEGDEIQVVAINLNYEM